MANVKIYKRLPKIFWASFYRLGYVKKNIIYIQWVKVTVYNFRNDTIRWQMLNSASVSYTFLR